MGGAIHASGGTGSFLEVADSTFTLNVASNTGGAILTSVQNALVFKSDFTQNRTRTSNGSIGTIGFQGGAIHADVGQNSDPTRLVIAGGTFQDNVADRVGGALSVGEGASVVIRSAAGLNGTPQFIGNRALAEDGGAIFSRGNLTVRDAVFADNQSRNGAGLFLESGSLSLIDSDVTGNDARVRGGGLFVASGATFFEDSFFADNTALRGPDPNIFDENT